MKKIGDALFAITNAFEAKNFLNPKVQAENLLLELFQCSRPALYQRLNENLEDFEEIKIKSWLAKRLKGEPLAYISEEVEFYGCRLKVNPSVLIPRQETEILVGIISRALKGKNLQGKALWDVCCGSGAIGIALKKSFPDLKVSLSDISEEAIEMTRQNAILNQVTVECFKGDLLAPFRGKKADFIVCNPPYISEIEYEQLDQEVKLFEPKMALVGGSTGLEIYERLSRELRLYLNNQAKVWFEIGYQQGERIKELFKDSYWVKKYFENDWAGHNRFFFLENE